MTEITSAITKYFGYTTITVSAYERALVWHQGDLQQVLAAGKHRFFALSKESEIELFSRREPWFKHDRLDILAKSELLRSDVEFLNLEDHQRALVWIDGRFAKILGPGLHAWWLGQCLIHHEIIDINGNGGRFEHPQFEAVVRSSSASSRLKVFTVGTQAAVIRQVNGQTQDILPPGRYAYWLEANDALYTTVELREQTLDISGQDIMTADKVTLRLNVSLSFMATDPVKFLSVAADAKQALYREAQLLLRAAVGGKELDALLADKDSLSKDLQELLLAKAEQYGLSITSLGVRDIILPGEMKNLLNKVMEAKKAAEAALVSRREETAALRHQVNSARLLTDNPTLMRLRELECLEKVAATGELKILLSEKGLVEKVTNLI